MIVLYVLAGALLLTVSAAKAPPQRSPSPARGLNLMHAEGSSAFAARYAARRPQIEPLLQRFGAAELRTWAQGLGITTFVGSSGRDFLAYLKAAPLLRAWLHRLRGLGVDFHMRHRCLGLEGNASMGDAPPPLRFATPHGEQVVQADVLPLALGGVSWSRLGSGGAWLPWFRERYAGAPLKYVALRCSGPQGVSDANQFEQTSEFILTAVAIEGGLDYAASPLLCDTSAALGHALATQLKSRLGMTE